MVDAERIAEVIDARIELEEKTILSVDGIVDECITGEMERIRAKSNMKRQCVRRIELLMDIKEELIG